MTVAPAIRPGHDFQHAPIDLYPCPTIEVVFEVALDAALVVHLVRRGLHRWAADRQ
jgi:hypothetical protein